MYALIMDGRVHQIFAARPNLHPDLQIVDASASPGIKPGWTYDGTRFAAPIAEPLPVRPTVVTPRQFRLALLTAGLLDDVEALMASPQTPRALRIEWEYATEIHSDNAAWPQMIGALNKTPDDLSAIFEAAAQIT